MEKIIRIICGLVFVFSSVSKLVDLDSFDLYIYSFNQFSFDVVSILSRMLIIFEFTVGTFLLIGVYYKKTHFISIISLILFSIFVGYEIFIGSEENCNCFGDVIVLNPVQSLCKNILLIILLFFIRKHEPISFKYNHPAGKILSAGIVIFLGVFFAPDFLYNDLEKSNNNFNLEIVSEESRKALSELKDSLIYIDQSIICFFSSKCSHCKKAAKKISSFAKKYGVESNVIYCFPEKSKEVEDFINETNSNKLQYFTLKNKDFFKLADRSVPKIFLIENGLAVQTFGYRTFSEDLAIKFLTKKIKEPVITEFILA